MAPAVARRRKVHFKLPAHEYPGRADDDCVYDCVDYDEGLDYDDDYTTFDERGGAYGTDDDYYADVFSSSDSEQEDEAARGETITFERVDPATTRRKPESLLTPLIKAAASRPKASAFPRAFRRVQAAVEEKATTTAAAAQTALLVDEAVPVAVANPLPRGRRGRPRWLLQLKQSEGDGPQPHFCKSVNRADARLQHVLDKQMLEREDQSRCERRRKDEMAAAVARFWNMVPMPRFLAAFAVWLTCVVFRCS